MLFLLQLFQSAYFLSFLWHNCLFFLSDFLHFRAQCCQVLRMKQSLVSQVGQVYRADTHAHTSTHKFTGPRGLPHIVQQCWCRKSLWLICPVAHTKSNLVFFRVSLQLVHVWCFMFGPESTELSFSYIFPPHLHLNSEKETNLWNLRMLLSL